MNKKTSPFSEPRKLRLAFASNFINFGIVRNKLLYTFKAGAGWFDIPIVPGSLKTSCIQTNDKIFDINISFRISYATSENTNKMEYLVDQPLIAAYTSAGNREKVAGTLSNPLKMRIRTPENFDGFECFITGSQLTPECFLE